MKLTSRWIAITALSAASLVGCSSANKLKLSSMDDQRNFTQEFPQAYVSQSASGDYDIVMIRQTAAPAHTTGPLQPVHILPRQMVHVRVYWKPVRGTKMDHPAATNASIHWYIFGDTATSDDLLAYDGAGLVMITSKSKTAEIEIRNGILKESGQRGSMRDPLGPSTVHGTIVAKRDDQKVAEILAELKSADQSLAAGAAERSVVATIHDPDDGPPARTPLGP